MKKQKSIMITAVIGATFLFCSNSFSQEKAVVQQNNSTQVRQTTTQPAPVNQGEKVQLNPQPLPPKDKSKEVKHVQPVQKQQNSEKSGGKTRATEYLRATIRSSAA